MSKAEEKQTVRDATDSFYEWIHGKTMPGLRPSPKQCYEAGYNNALAGIPNPEAVRELIEAVREWTDVEKCVTDERIFKALAALSAPSTGAQQKGE